MDGKIEKLIINIVLICEIDNYCEIKNFTQIDNYYEPKLVDYYKSNSLSITLHVNLLLFSLFVIK